MNGKCACGCGQDTPIAKQSSTKRGWKRGEPIRFMHGHNSSMLRHGEWNKGQASPEYRSFFDAKSRCTNPKVKNYKDYGGRGIKFLFVNFEQMLAEIGRRPGPGKLFQLDRINNDGNYESGNIRWATRKQQIANRRKAKNARN